MTSIRSYALVTAAYWGFTITDGALRMLVVLHFYKLGYSDVTIAFLFLFYEFFGIVTNLFGGWIAVALRLQVTLYGGLRPADRRAGDAGPAPTRVAAKSLSVAYVMAAQALSGIAKDLTKMSAKSAIKVIVPEAGRGALFRWVARLTGSKNALKGVGFFVGGLLLAGFGFVGALVAMAAALFVVLLAHRRSLFRRPRPLQEEGQIHGAALQVVRHQLALRRPSIPVRLPRRLVRRRAARLPVGTWLVVQRRSAAFLALWVIGYGIVQAAVPSLLRLLGGRDTVNGVVPASGPLFCC